jgi:hypothetical protein
MKITIDNNKKKMIKSYVRAVVASAFVLVLALAADIKPEIAVLLGALLAPVARYIDPSETDFGIIAEDHVVRSRCVAIGK